MYKPLFITYVRTYVRTYVCIYVFLFTGFGVVSCMNLTQYSVSECNYLVNEYICLIRKKEKEKVKLDSYRWGLNYNVMFDKDIFKQI